MKQQNYKEFFLSSWAVDNRVTVYVITFLVVLLGVVSYNNLPKENFPEIAVPTIYVGTLNPGTSPEHMEEEVTRPIEKQLKSIKGYKEIKSNSIQDYSVVIVEFETNVDLKEAKREVKEAVDKAKADLPTDLPQDPNVQDINLSEIPIMFINVYGELDDDTKKKYAEQLQDEIEGLQEIRRVDLVGGNEKEIQIDVDLAKMEANGIAFGDIQNAIAQRDVIISGGAVELDQMDFAIQISGKFESVDQIGNLILRNSRGAPVYLKDIAKVQKADKDTESYARLDGSGVMTLNVIKKAGENLISASEKIHDVVHVFEEERIRKDDRGAISFNISGDQSQLTKNMVADLTNTIVMGFLLVTVVLMFFMGVRDSMFVGLSVPLSSLIAFAVLPWIGFTLNLVVLFTFIFALGIVVDNAIVVIENTYRIYNSEKLSIIETAKKAAGEVIIPVFSGTLTTMAPFLPLAFWEGIIGEFMFFLPITIMITLVASLLVAYVINPVFAVTFMKRDSEIKGYTLKGFAIIIGIMLVIMALSYMGGAKTMGNIMLIGAILGILNRFVLGPSIRWFQRKAIPAMLNFYRRTLKWVLVGRRPYLVLGATIGLFFLSFVLIGMFPPKVVFFPETDPNFIYVFNEMPIGTNVEKTNEVTKELESRVYSVLGKNNPAVKSIITNVSIGAGDQMDFNKANPIPHKGRIQVEFVEFKERNGVSTAQYLRDIRSAMKGIKEATVTVEKESSGPPTAKPVNIEIKGDEIEGLIEVATDMREYLDSLIKEGVIVGVEGLNWDLDLGKPQLVVDLDHDKISALGMNTAQIGMAIRTAVFGSEVSQFRELEDEFPIMVRLDARSRDDIEAIENMRINYRDMSTGFFHNVPIKSVANVRKTETYGGINRIDLKKEVTIYSNVLQDYNPNEVVTNVIFWMEAYKQANERKLGGISVEMTGELEEQAETSAFLGGAMLTSLLLIFLILVAQFNSMTKVFIILTQILFSMIGVFMGFALSGMDISIVMAGVGIVSLAGIVVNNGIILLDFIQQMKDRGFRTRESIIEGSVTRFTPVLLTASSTVLGLVPLAVAMNVNFGTLITDLNPHIFFGGDNASFWGPLSWTIIYGLSFATIVTLVIVPALYYIFHISSIRSTRRRLRWNRRLEKLLK